MQSATPSSISINENRHAFQHTGRKYRVKSVFGLGLSLPSMRGEILSLVAGAGGREKAHGVEAQDESRSMRYSNTLVDILSASVFCKLALTVCLSLDKSKSEGDQGIANSNYAIIASFFCHFSATYLTWTSINSYLLRYWDDSLLDMAQFFANSLLLGLLGIVDSPTFLLCLASSRFLIIIALLCNLQGSTGGTTGGQYAFMRSAQLFLAAIGYMALRAMTPCTEVHMYPFFVIVWIMTLVIDNMSLKAHCLALHASNTDLLPQKRERHISLVVCIMGYLLLGCFSTDSSSLNMSTACLALTQITLCYLCYFAVYDGAGEACLCHAADSETRLRGLLWTMAHFPLAIGLALIGPIMSSNVGLSSATCVTALGLGVTMILSSIWLMRLTHIFPHYDSQIGSESGGLGSSSSDFGYGAIAKNNSNRSQAVDEGFAVFLRVIISTGARSCFHLLAAPVVGLITISMSSSTSSTRSSGESRVDFRAFATSISLQCFVLLCEYFSLLAGRLASTYYGEEEDAEKGAGALTNENLERLSSFVDSQESSPAALEGFLKITPQRSSSSLTSGNGGGKGKNERTSLLFTAHTPEAKSGDVLKKDLVVSPSLATPSNSRLNTKY